MSEKPSDQAWSVYLLRCDDNSVYCGITNNLPKRLKQHNGAIKGGAKYTQARQPCILVYVEQHASRAVACQQEYAIKQLSKAAKEQLIATGGIEPCA
ncbi:GIY-YIG nuclease family protein [Thiomicrorhabdus aquaedulcis]|uniref:GIY-YIG nuclease family protein n=1 Tax=Thiomicrorhabdus aquaedulcis TaxID=2211106 RepID=UPI000FDBBF94|nr:GIY-YIG nuclease family protein [Thiomicrorhabdus aquaedulcis]